jgi:hypothetical protein
MEWQRRNLPVHGASQPSAALRPGEGTIVMVFPKRVVLLVDKTNMKVLFEPGIHNVPEHLADHWYLKANGATRHDMPVAPDNAPSPESEDDPEAISDDSSAPRRGRGRPRVNP